MFGSDGLWWSSTLNGQGLGYRRLLHLDSVVVRQSHLLNFGRSVRCLRGD